MTPWHIADRQFIAFVRDASIRELQRLQAQHPYMAEWKLVVIQRAITRRRRELAA
jgi:predicted glutamine amidotransferase